MLDIRKWIALVESVHPHINKMSPTDAEFKRDATVILGANVGGGVGRFVEFTTEDAAIIDVKGVMRELNASDFAIPERDLTTGNDWFHMSVDDVTAGTSNDTPEFRPGDMVKIADVYGAVIGPGFGVFIGYGTTGEDCIILFDGKQIVVPVENVASVLEQNAKDNFDQTDNDGNLSPMSFGSDNVKIEQPQNCGMQSREPAMDQRDEFTKWMETVEEALTDEVKTELGEMLPPPSNECGCERWNCEVCFPSHAEQTDMAPNQEEVCSHCGHAQNDGHSHEDMMHGAEEPLDMDPHTFGMEEDAEEIEIPAERERGIDGRGVKLGSIVQKFVPTDSDSSESPLTHGGENLGEEIPNEASDYGQAGKNANDHFNRSFEVDEDNWYEPANSEFGEFDPEDENGQAEYHKQMAGSPKSEADVEAAMDMISEITYMQGMGLSMADKNYSEDELANMGFDELKKIASTVKGSVTEEMPDTDDSQMGADMGMGAVGPSSGGQYPPGTAPTMPESVDPVAKREAGKAWRKEAKNAMDDKRPYSPTRQSNDGKEFTLTDVMNKMKSQGTPAMENVDKDVAAMLNSLKKYDTLKESVAPVLMARPVVSEEADKSKIPAAKRKESGKEDWKVTKADLDKEEEKNISGKKGLDKMKKDSGINEAGKKPDFLDMDKDGDKEEPMKKALKDKEEINESADADVLEWMNRFSKLGNMKGYGR